MAYQRTTWVTETTPLSAANMNNIEDGVEEALDGVNDIRDNFASLFLDTFYPVGSYYETSKSSFNPGVAWGGTWVLEIPGQVHVSGGTGYTVSKANNADGAGESDGGNKHAIIPYHNHGFTNPTISRSTNVAVSVSGGSHTHSYARLSRTTEKLREVEAGSRVNYGVTGTSNHTTGETAHTHTVSVTQPAFSASGGSVSYTGVTTVNANMQPYINVYRWHRTA